MRTMEPTKAVKAKLTNTVILAASHIAPSGFVDGTWSRLMKLKLQRAVPTHGARVRPTFIDGVSGAA